jgi:hypothetical protein
MLAAEESPSRQLDLELVAQHQGALEHLLRPVEIVGIRKPVRLQIVCGRGQQIDQVQQTHSVERVGKWKWWNAEYLTREADRINRSISTLSPRAEAAWMSGRRSSGVSAS